MSQYSRIAIALIATLGILGFAQTAESRQLDKRTNLTVHERIEIPGAVLEPGKYVMGLVESASNRNIVRFTNERGDRVISTVIAVPNYRMRPTGDTALVFHETPAGQPPSLKAWFAPGDNFGQEFVYKRDDAERIARDTRRYVPAAELDNSDDVRVIRETTVVAIGPDRDESDTETASARNEQADRETPPRRRNREPVTADNEPTQMAQNQNRNQRPNRLPTTASPLPLVALLGLLSFGGAAIVGRLGK